jgi:DNA-directed RNA polymerase III subunit RPC5
VIGYVIVGENMHCTTIFYIISFQIPVYLSQALSKNLYIYQYPVRPATRDWNEVKVTNASIKPKNRLVRLEVGLDTYSDKYCPSKGEQIALNTDGQQVIKIFV